MAPKSRYRSASASVLFEADRAPRRRARPGTILASSGPYRWTWDRKSLLGPMRHEVAQSLGEGLVGSTQFFLAAPQQHAGPGLKSGAGHFARQGGLAHPGLTTDQHDFS